MSSNLLEDVREGTGLTLAPLTVDQYHQMIRDGILRDGQPIELIQGALIYKDRRDNTGGIMTHGRRHLKTLNKLTAVLSRWVAGRAAFLQVQGPITIDGQSEPEPDCCIVIGSPDDFTEAIPNAAAVMAVFEVADSSLRADRGTKQRLYAEGGIPIYVIINLKENVVEVLTEPIPADSTYANRIELRNDQNVELPIGTLGQMSLNGQDLF